MTERIDDNDDSERESEYTLKPMLLILDNVNLMDLPSWRLLYQMIYELENVAVLLLHPTDF